MHGDRHNERKIRKDAERAYLDTPTARGDSLDDYLTAAVAAQARINRFADGKTERL